MPLRALLPHLLFCVVILSSPGCLSLEGPESGEMIASAGPQSGRSAVSPSSRGKREVSTTRSSFSSIGGFTIALEPSSVYLERGKDVTVQIIVSRMGEFRGPITITISSLPTKVSANAPLTIAPSEIAGSLTLSATQRTPFQVRMLIVTAKGQAGRETLQHSQALSLQVSRRLGPFTEAVPDFRSPGGSKSSRNRALNVKVLPGAEVGLSEELVATFQTTAGKLKGDPIGFYVDPGTQLGGAGFCRDSLAGVVLSANAQNMGFAAEYVLTFLSFSPPTATSRLEVNAAGLTGIRRPRVLFSPDCTLAIVVGFAHTGRTEQSLSVIDLLSGEILGRQDSLHSLIFSAGVRLRNQQPTVEIRADGQITSYPLDVPAF
jgi:hypothetical protein